MIWKLAGGQKNPHTRFLSEYLYGHLHIHTYIHTSIINMTSFQMLVFVFFCLCCVKQDLNSNNGIVLQFQEEILFLNHN